ncbi:MAG: GTPase ObgE [Candidatus Pacebacteria bacterium]|nr:GTPase ObgE [Candidatus Paceibacterota bacterium]
MAFIDELSFHIKAGRGGDGVVRWLHEKGKEFMGPAGGDGGRGGDVYVRAVSDLGLLLRYRNKKEFEAENAGHGFKRSMHGKNGEDLYIDLPVGCIVTNISPLSETNATTAETSISLEEVGQTTLILKGGRGGFGNEHFKASTNVKPMESTEGKDGEEADFHIELELIAAAGFVGLPNAGKSSLLNALTNANAKIGSYQFTTLEPNLGALYEFVLADIPGLIEGASEGKGLGHKFLRHIKRTRMLFHCVSLESETATEMKRAAEKMAEDYKTVRAELAAFDPTLVAKPEYIIFTKTDSLDHKVAQEKIKVFSQIIKKMPHAFEVSILDNEAVKKLSQDLVGILREA